MKGADGVEVDKEQQLVAKPEGLLILSQHVTKVVSSMVRKVRKGVDKSHDHPLVLPLLEVEIYGAVASILSL
jgi:hypothetical protein